MEKVMCVKCGSIGYTASPEQVSCYECSGRLRAVRLEYEDRKPVKRKGQ